MKCQACNKKIRLRKGEDTRSLCAVCQSLSETDPQKIIEIKQKELTKKPHTKKFLCCDCGKETPGLRRCAKCKDIWNKKNADCFA